MSNTNKLSTDRFLGNGRLYWDSLADDTKFTATFDLNLFTRLVDHKARILDFGCGYGRILTELAHAKYQKLYGVDFSMAMLEKTKMALPQIDLIQCCSSQLPLKDNTFDAVLLIAVLTCIASDVLQQQLINELFRILKPGGLIYVSDFLINTDSRNIERYLAFQKNFGSSDYPYGVFNIEEHGLLRHQAEDHILKLFSNFKTMLFEKQKFQTMGHHKSNGATVIGMKLEETI